MSDWITFTGEYEKKWYDIETKPGVIRLDCWANAGMFHCVDDGKFYLFGTVHHIRETDDPFLREIEKIRSIL